MEKEERSDVEWNIVNKKTICSWQKFLKFWKQHYPKIRLASPSADICTDCHVFFNRSKFAGAGTDLNPNSINNNTTRNEINGYDDNPPNSTTTLQNENEIENQSKFH